MLLPVAALQETAVHKERHAFNISGVFGGNISVVPADLSPVFILLKTQEGTYEAVLDPKA